MVVFVKSGFRIWAEVPKKNIKLRKRARQNKRNFGSKISKKLR